MRAARGKARLGSYSARLSGLTAGVLAVATYFHHVRLFGLFTILAAILAILFRRTIARRMRAFVLCVLSHETSLLSGWLVLEPLS